MIMVRPAMVGYHRRAVKLGRRRCGGERRARPIFAPQPCRTRSWEVHVHGRHVGADGAEVSCLPTSRRGFPRGGTCRTLCSVTMLLPKRAIVEVRWGPLRRAALLVL